MNNYQKYLIAEQEHPQLPTRGIRFERVEKRLVGWQKKNMFKGGKAVLIKSILSSILTYYMSIMHEPTTNETGKLEKLERNFLPDPHDTTIKFH